MSSSSGGVIVATSGRRWTTEEMNCGHIILTNIPILDTILQALPLDNILRIGIGYDDGCDHEGNDKEDEIKIEYGDDHRENERCDQEGEKEREIEEEYKT